ncbi:hypothetical protein [Clostridium sp. 'White wine YQ']|uniref:hypothetical protein n=1 Tax=Clostridium sp. 'White wine YQ' TaxID=3027474 RepID=UPI0023659F11|nr:hypothetical protein [Clostridium sp. 'White wine YQ']MDD7793168.1 hypothetical protein [Clostridium sp. 'White wine YQ']
MDINISTIVMTIINILVLIAIIAIIYSGIKSFRSFIRRNKENDRKLDMILSKLDEQKNK